MLYVQDFYAYVSKEPLQINFPEDSLVASVKDMEFGEEIPIVAFDKEFEVDLAVSRRNKHNNGD